jgi:NAD+ synthase
MIGWFVKDGIDDVPVQPLMKLYKTQVQELAQYLNVPEKVRGSRPAPDMQKGITDEFGIRLSYRRLDQILDAWHQSLSDPAIVQQGIMQEELQKVRQLHQLSAWKGTSSHEVPPVDGLPGSVLRKDSVMRSDTGAFMKIYRYLHVKGHLWSLVFYS